MGFEYSCFISYRHGDISACVQKLKDDIESQLRSHVNKPLPVYLDTTRNKTGDPLDATLAQKVCKSMVFVMAYEPTYFSDESVWCTQELVAFLGHEKRRLDEIKKKVPGVSLTDYHQLVPVAFKKNAYSKIPEKISERIYADWSADLVTLGWDGFVKDMKYRTFLHHVVQRVLDIQLGLTQKHGITTLDVLAKCNVHGSTLPKPGDLKCREFIQENWKRRSVI